MADNYDQIIYHEDFVDGPGPWVSGKDNDEGRWAPNIFGKRGDSEPLIWRAEGGPGGKPYVSSCSPWYFDDNHGQFMWFYMVLLYPSDNWMEELGDKDLRNARVSINIRGNGFERKETKLCAWTQGISPKKDGYYVKGGVYYCWALTSQMISNELDDSQWHELDFRLHNDENAWSQMGIVTLAKRIIVLQSTTAATGKLDHILNGHHVNIGFMLAGIDPNDPPTGGIDLSEVTISTAQARE